MPFLDNNVAAGIPADGAFQVGRSDLDTDGVGGVERGVLLPVASDAAASWAHYDCTVGVVLDSGIVIYNRLPQVDVSRDTLASCDIGDPALDTIKTSGVNLRCQDQYRDIVQRMGHARYWFRLWGQALRVGYRIPIPGLKKIGSVDAIPYDKNPQWAFNRIAPGGNFSGLVLWHAAWSLWYTTDRPPYILPDKDIAMTDPGAHITTAATLPAGMQSPFTQPDDNVQPSAPPLRIGVPVQ